MERTSNPAGAATQVKATGARRTIDVALALLIAAGLGLPGLAGAAEDRPDDAAGTAGWEWGPSLLWYVLPNEPGYLQPTLAVDRGGLHLEARYNYEARNAGSAWFGWNFSFGDECKLGLTPMVGGVFGEMTGVAPGLTLTLEWGPLALWSQSEYVFDLADSSQSYVYVWSELSITGPDWLRVGLVLQRTRVFQTSTEFQGGPLFGLSF
ncbi:MAG TPA: hypothetical protein VFM45_11345, partial [Anaeromyxobacteraceae bacterium]|nr:hypothetical protein [Anaeromyxobacteraceae bacterium]